MLWKYFPDIIDDLRVTILYNDKFVDGIGIVVEEGVDRDCELFDSVARGDDDADITVG